MIGDADRYELLLDAVMMYAGAVRCSEAELAQQPRAIATARMDVMSEVRLWLRWQVNRVAQERAEDTYVALMERVAARR